MTAKQQAFTAASSAAGYYYQARLALFESLRLTGRQLDEVFLLSPSAVPATGGATAISPTVVPPIGGLFGGVAAPTGAAIDNPTPASIGGTQTQGDSNGGGIFNGGTPKARRNLANQLGRLLRCGTDV